jgi:hypothetical protein
MHTDTPNHLDRGLLVTEFLNMYEYVVVNKRKKESGMKNNLIYQLSTPHQDTIDM